MRRRLTRTILAAWTLGLFCPSTIAVAIPPPLPVHAAYGPLTQCLSGYRIDVAETEAVSVGDGLGFASDQFSLSLIPERTDLPPRASAIEVDVPGLGRINRHVVPAGSGQFGPAPRGPATAYVLPKRGQAGTVLVRSPQFDGSDRDLALLARIAPVDPARDRCGQFAAPDYAGETPEALYWSPVRHRGPRFHCQNGIGFPVGEAEALQLTWARDAWSRVHAGERRLVVLGPTVPARQAGRARGPVAAGYSPTINPNSEQLSILVLAAPPSRRANPPYNHQISIQFRPGDEAHARALAERLEFVDRNDRRCRPA